MKRISIFISVLVLSAGAVSCNKSEVLQGGRNLSALVSDRAISLRPTDLAGNGTKAVIDTTRLPEGYTIYLSGYVTDKLKPENTGNYFTSIPFNLNAELSSGIKDGTTGPEPDPEPERRDIWTGTPTQYWPLSGSITFLGIAVEDPDYQTNLHWSDLRNTDGVTVTVPEEFDGTSEILYGYTPLFEKEVDGVQMQFIHTQALLEFNFESKCEDLVRLDSIKITNAYAGGKLYVSNYPVSYAKWDTDDLDAKDIPVPDIAPQTILNKGEDKSYSIVIVPKAGQDFVVYFKQRANVDCDWETMSFAIPFAYSEPTQKWKAGVKYAYTFTIDPGQITVVSADVIDWDYNKDVTDVIIP